MSSIIPKTDSYKLQHWFQMPDGTTRDYAYFESRSGAKFPYTLWFGLQAIIRKHLAGRVVTGKAIEEAALLSAAHFGDDKRFNRPMWNRILRKHKGRLPIRIKSVREGTIVPTGNVLMTVENTDDKCAALTTGLESLLTHVWYPSTVATQSHFIKGLIREALKESSENLNGLDFMLHDFGYRGVTVNEAAEIGGAAHLINFKGTDTLVAIIFLLDYYANEPVDGQNPFNGIGYSVPATQHSIMSALGRDGETSVVRSLITNYPTGILSVVADTYGIYNFVNNIMGVTLKAEILARDGIFVVRPDSVTPQHATPAAEMAWILESLANNFGYTINNKGYKVINPKVRALWGDGLDIDSIKDILSAVMTAGFSVENIATFGMGGGLLQKVNRDTQRFAFKSCWQMRNGIGYDVWKEPLDVSKASKRGRLKLIKNDNGQYQTVAESASGTDLLETVFLNGKVMRTQTLDEVRQNASAFYV